MAAKKNVFGAAAGAAMLLGLALFAAGNTPDRTTQSSPNAETMLQQKGPGMLVFVLSEETGDTIADANLRVAMKLKKDDFSEIFYLKTNELGFCRIEFGQLRPFEMQLIVSKAGYVTMAFEWNEGRDIPDEYTFRLEKGTVIGGKVVNEQGNPVAGAFVGIGCPWKRSSEKAWVDIREIVKTDADGKWSVNIVPSDIEKASIYIRLRHPDYFDEEPYNEFHAQVTIPALRSREAIIVLRRKFTVSGRVIDTNSNPVRGARLKFGHDINNKEMETQADGSGHFKFDPPYLQREQIMRITAEAETYVPRIQEFDANSLKEPIEFVLEPGRHVSGRVIDVNGSPLEGAQLIAGYRFRSYQTDWRIVTDKDGRFEWHSAPPDRVEIYVRKDGYMRVDENIVATEKKYEFVLHKTLRIMGKVVDAESSKPIDKFDLTSRILRRGGGQGEMPGIKHADGCFDIVFDSYGPEYEVEVKAIGYAPSTSRRFSPDEGTLELQIRMVRAARENIPQGTVYLPDGNVAPGAEVYVVTSGLSLRLEEGRRINYGGTEGVRTDSAGRFTAVGQSEKFKLFAIHENGYAEVTQEQLAESSDIHLKPWGRVEGTVRTHSGPVAYVRVRLSPEPLRILREPQQIQFSYTIGTDEQGKFVMDRVIAGQMRVRRVTWDEDGASRTEREGASKLVEVVPGETAFVELTAGRTIVGKLVVSDKITGFRGWDHAIGRFDDLWVDREMLVTTYEYETMPQQQGNQQSENLRNQAGQKQVWKPGGKSPVSRFFSVGSDGSFRIDDVQPGDHALNVTVWERQDDPNGGSTTYSIGKASHQFTVPEMAPDQEDKPLDLGVIVIEPLDWRR